MQCRKYWSRGFLLDLLCTGLTYVCVQAEPFHNCGLLRLLCCCFRVNLRHHIKSSRCLSVSAVKAIPGNCLLNNSSVYCTSFLFVVVRVERLCSICTMLVGSLFKTLCSRAIWSSTEIIFHLPQLKKIISSNIILRLENKALSNWANARFGKHDPFFSDASYITAFLNYFFVMKLLILMWVVCLGKWCPSKLVCFRRTGLWLLWWESKRVVF